MPSGMLLGDVVPPESGCQFSVTDRRFCAIIESDRRYDRCLASTAVRRTETDWSMGAGMAGKHQDLVNHTKKYRAELHAIFLDLKSWRKFKSKWKLEWHKVRFGESNHSLVPKVRGIYVFTAELSPSKFPAHGYMLYIGITGNTSKQDLYKRYGQYLGYLKKKDGRPGIYYMLENWSDDLFFNYVPLPNDSIDLERIEQAFINAVLPLFNKRDIKATIRNAKAAAF